MAPTPNTHRPEARSGLTIRRLGDADTDAVRRLADRDSAQVPDGELLGLEIEGRLVAMQPLADGGEVIADPFARTAEVSALLELRTSQLRSRRRHVAVALHPRPGEPSLHPLTLLTRAS